MVEWELKIEYLSTFEACCQWALLHVQITTLLHTFTVHMYVYPSVNYMNEIFSNFESTVEWTFFLQEGGPNRNDQRKKPNS